MTNPFYSTQLVYSLSSNSYGRGDDVWLTHQILDPRNGMKLDNDNDSNS